MESQNPQQQKILTLLRQKQKEPSNNDLETEFFNAALEYLLNTSTDHWWCNKSLLPIAQESLWLFSLPDHDPIIQYKTKLNNQLKTCTHCVEHYQSSKSNIRKRYEETFPATTVNDFFEGINQFDISRVMSTLENESSSFSMTNEVMCAILEIIYAPHLLSNSSLDEIFGNTFNLIQKTGSFPTFHVQTTPYIFRMTVYHHRVVRFWARKLLEKYITVDHYVLLEEDFLKMKSIIYGMFKSFSIEDEFTDINRECPFRIIPDLGEFWKAFRLFATLAPSDMLLACLKESNTSMPDLIQAQLSTSAEWLGEILKTMTSMLLKMQAGFWGTISENSSIYYDIMKRICEHTVFLTAMKIAREGNIGKILQRDGSPYPDDKLMAKIKSMLEWIYPFWSSLRHTHIEKEITQKTLDITFGYFQMNTWGVMSKAYCAELGLQIIDQCIADNSVPTDKVNEYILKIIGFAVTDEKTLPTLVQHMPKVAKNILSDLVDRDSSWLNKAFAIAYQVDDGEVEDDALAGDKMDLKEIDKKSPYEQIWASIKGFLNKDVQKYPWLATLLFKAYANVASMDIPDLLNESGLSSDRKCLVLRITDIRLTTARTLQVLSNLDWKIRKSFYQNNSEMIKPLLHLVCSPYPELKQSTSKLIQQQPRPISDYDLYHELFYLANPLKAIEAFTSILREFTQLNNAPQLDVFKSVPTIVSFLTIQLELLVQKDDGYLTSSSLAKEDEDSIIQEFWDVCWRVIGVIFEKGLVWATKYKPSAVVNLILPTLDAARHLMTNKSMFETAIQTTTGQEKVSLAYDNMSTMTDSLSHWIYVTRKDMISRLVPLIVTILKTLQKAEIKISVEAYDRLMTAATGVNDSKLTDEERTKLFMALSAHEPTNFIFLNDDSDDEDVEWQTINTAKDSSSSKPPKRHQLTLDQSFSQVSIKSPSRAMSSDSRITKSIPPTTAEAPQEISDDEVFDDIDMSEIPDEWLQMGSGSESQHVTTNDSLMDVDRQGDANAATNKLRPSVARFYPPETKTPTFAVTSKGRKLRPPAMGFSSKMRSLREEHRAERRLIAAAKSPSAAGIVRQRYGGNHSSDSSSSSEDEGDEGGDDSGLWGLIHDMDDGPPSIKDNKPRQVKAESASVKALFESKPKRAVKLIETPITNDYLERKFKAKAQEQRRRQKITPSIDRLFKAILSWDMTETREIPPNTNEAMYNNVPSTFASFEEYRSTFEPLLILETWCQLQRAKEQLSQNDVLERCLVEGRCHTNDFVDITFGMPMSLIANNLSQDDLVCVANHFGPHFFSNDEMAPWRGKSFLGKVTSINQKKNMGEVVVRSYFTTDRISTLNSVSPKTSWCILKVMSLTTTMREYAALEGLEYYDLGKDIIQPKLSSQPHISSSTIRHYCERYDVNEPQSIAIVSAIQKKRGFSLIQGPPGTGKTKTILSLIVSLLDQRANATSTDSTQPYGAGKLLVCAPSNAAVDEIAKRLKEGVMTSNGMRTPNVVRIGVADSVNASVKDRILERLIEAEMDASNGESTGPNGNNKWGSRLDSLHQDIRTIQISLDDVDREITQSGSDMVQMAILRDKRKALGAKLVKAKIMLKDTYQDQKNHGREMEVSRIRARQKVFANADVVCATLSGSGHDMLTAMGVSFETVIVDEAAQSIEISSLIPLKFDTQRCILVGDPNQLPPTVMSTLAAKYDYQQSLFMRLEKTIEKEVNLLSIQYRMHPDISRFPSKMFYQSRLLDGPNMATVSSAEWHKLPEFPPYRFFNVLDGQEKVGRGKSIFNVAEADAAVALVDMLCSRLPTIKFASKIGVITPYKQQVGQLKSRFQRRFGNAIMDVIDFNTVDGFQGQEKEIIIFSCVRAGSGRGIGFLADVRRMNVGLTRAKCSLFVLGHARSLSHSDRWGELVRDAQSRSLITDCEFPYFRHYMNDASIPQNIFERNIVITKQPVLPRRKGPVKIDQPSSTPDEASPLSSPGVEPIGSKRKNSPPPYASRKRPHHSVPEDVTMEDNNRSFIQKVRQEKEKKSSSRGVPIVAPSNASGSKKISMNDYKSIRGHHGNSNNGSSLFINKRRPQASRPQHEQQKNWPEGVGARERAVMNHAADRDRMRQYREEERRRMDGPPSSKRDPVRNINSLVDDAQNRYNRNQSRRF
ncbi:SEN1 N terminal-domain-containing protein [Choanephora cucurbitarum]|nr:SEN1 N terminal-domain-containing protein [Choanephora cucurbitarum]